MTNDSNANATKINSETTHPETTHSQKNNKLNGNSEGIQELIELLKEKGVSAGKDEGIKIVSDAESRANWIVEQAKAEAQNIIESAKNEARFIKNAGQESLHLAFRDVVLRLKDELSVQFANQLKQLIQHELKEPDTLKQLIKQAAANTDLPDEDMSISLPSKILGLNELRENPEALKGGPLIEALSSVTREMLKSSVRFQAGIKGQQGISFSLRDGEIVVELTDETLTQMLLLHLQPRFRALLEGVIA